jgi:hypothetical protein
MRLGRQGMQDAAHASCSTLNAALDNKARAWGSGFASSARVPFVSGPGCAVVGSFEGKDREGDQRS